MAVSTSSTVTLWWQTVYSREFRYDKSSYLTDMIGSDWIPSIILSSFCHNNNAQATTTVPHLTCNTEKIITKGCYRVWAMHVNRNLGPSWFWQNVWTNCHLYMYVSNIHVTVRIGDHTALKLDTKPEQYVTLHFCDWRGTATLRHRNCAENVIILVWEQKPYQARFLWWRKSYPAYCGHRLRPGSDPELFMSRT